MAKPFRTFVIGDIHGAYHALVQCLERCGFRKEIDLLITLGDICDGWPYVYECVEELLTITKTINVMGNHDEWFRRWLKMGRHPDMWMQGGMGTARSYLRQLGKEQLVNNAELDYKGYLDFDSALNPGRVPESHHDFFNKQMLYYKDDNNRLFVHGGFNRHETLEAQKGYNPSVFSWDRDLWDEALSVHPGESLNFTEEFSEIYIGHTTTLFWTKFRKTRNSLVLLPTEDTECAPMKADIIYNLDTGAGSSGRLTIMDIDTHDYWQSDLVNTFYGEYKPRR